jgi:hypothetical protein
MRFLEDPRNKLSVDRAAQRKEKGGSPEDARHEVMSMQAVAEVQAKVKPSRVLPSLESPEAKAGKWLDDLIAKSKVAGVLTQIVDVGPSLARALLNRNQENRKVSDIVIESYSRDMRNDAWKFNGEPIIVSADGQLNDGQHRCEAIIMADREIECLLVIGVERDSRTTVDQGKVRTLGDFLSMRGHVDTNVLGACANMVWQYRSHQMVRCKAAQRPTKSQLINFVEEHPGLDHSMHIARRKGSYAVGGNSMLAATNFLFAEKAGRNAADDFTIALIDGASLRIGNPILYARNRLVNESKRLTQQERFELIIKAWNAHRAGEEVRGFKLVGGKLPKISE